MPLIISAMHGAPLNDFPTNETVELLNLHAWLEHAAEKESLGSRDRYDHQDDKMLAWSYNPENDALHFRSNDLCRHLHEVLEQGVILGFNEFFHPNLEKTFGKAVGAYPDKTYVETPMMTREGEHSEFDIPSATERFKIQFPDLPVQCVWSLDLSHVAQILPDQISYFETK